MPFDIIKNSVEYCTENKLFFIFVLCVLFGLRYLTNLVDSIILGPVITAIFMMGYGLQVTEDIIKGGKRLPKLMPIKILNYGIKGYLIFFIYVVFQLLLLSIIAMNLNFPPLSIEDFVLRYDEFLPLLMKHDAFSGLVFVISTFLVIYVTTFFMELALARFADGGSLINAFNFPRIKRAIDIIGWRNYAWSYTKIIISILLLTQLTYYTIPIKIIDSVVDALLGFLIFVIEYMGIGLVYRYYVENK